jgi:hypothetical protein
LQVIWIRRMRVLRRMLQKYRDADKVDKNLCVFVLTGARWQCGLTACFASQVPPAVPEGQG